MDRANMEFNLQLRLADQRDIGVARRGAAFTPLQPKERKLAGCLEHFSLADAEARAPSLSCASPNKTLHPPGEWRHFQMRVTESGA